MALLEIRGLEVRFTTPEGEVRAVSGVDLDVEESECLAIVGESGSGKSQLLLACMGLLAANGRAQGGVRFAGQELLAGGERAMRSVRGSGVGLVFQDALGSLTPHMTVGEQMVETWAAAGRGSRSGGLAESRRMLQRVRVADAATRLSQYPHELSGGTRQRVAIAAALMARPRLLIADEPTTALDVTVQAQVVDLFRELRRELGMALVVVTHDLGVVAGLADRVAVMYAGRVVEQGTAVDVLGSPWHPYSAGLVHALPRLDDVPGTPMRTIPGQPPSLLALPPGCAYRTRCPRASGRCESARPVLQEEGRRQVACHHPLSAGAVT